MTDIVTHRDGGLYFTIGGRKTQSGLYRITYTGKQPEERAEASDAAADELRAIRSKPEKLHVGEPGEAALSECLSTLDTPIAEFDLRPESRWSISRYKHGGTKSSA